MIKAALLRRETLAEGRDPGSKQFVKRPAPPRSGPQEPYRTSLTSASSKVSGCWNIIAWLTLGTTV